MNREEIIRKIDENAIKIKKLHNDNKELEEEFKGLFIHDVDAAWKDYLSCNGLTSVKDLEGKYIYFRNKAFYGKDVDVLVGRVNKVHVKSPSMGMDCKDNPSLYSISLEMSMHYNIHHGERDYISIGGYCNHQICVGDKNLHIISQSDFSKRLNFLRKVFDSVEFKEETI